MYFHSKRANKDNHIYQRKKNHFFALKSIEFVQHKGAMFTVAARRKRLNVKFISSKVARFTDYAKEKWFFFRNFFPFFKAE